MESRRDGFTELIVIGLIGVAIVVAVLYFSGSFRSGSDDREMAQQGDRNTPSVEVSPTAAFPTEEIPTASSTEPEETATVPVDLPADAVIKTADEAVRHAMIVARDYLKADNPEVVSVEAVTLADALQTNATQLNEDPELALEGLAADEIAAPVWRVVLGNATFEVPRCPPAANESGERASCGTGPKAIITFEADTAAIAQVMILMKD